MAGFSWRLGRGARPDYSFRGCAPASLPRPDWRRLDLHSTATTRHSPQLVPSTLRVHLALITVSVLFGAHFVFTKLILAAVPAKSWVLFRIGAAMLLIVPLALWLRRQRGLPGLRTWIALAIASFFGVVLNQVLFTEGMALTTPEHSAVVNSCIPTWTLIVATIAGQEQLRTRKVLAI